MDLLEFASGPALNVAIGIFAVGVLWRLGYLLRMKKRVDKSDSRGGNEVFGGLWMIASRSINHGPLTDRIKAPIANAYLMHLVLAIVIFAAEEHIKLDRKDVWSQAGRICRRTRCHESRSAVLLATIAVTVYRRLRHPGAEVVVQFRRLVLLADHSVGRRRPA